MNITRSNFQKALPLVQDSIYNASFVAIDFELSGIVALPQLKNSGIDSIETRYYKAKQNSKKFQPLQLGICSFKIEEKGKKVKASPFNFYLFPNIIDENEGDSFMCQSSSLQFLANHNFDFNKLIYDGIHYLSRQKQQNIENMSSMQSLKQLKQVILSLNQLMPIEYQKKQNIIKEQIIQFIESEISRADDSVQTLEIDIENVPYKVYQQLEKYFHEEYNQKILIDKMMKIQFAYDSQNALERKKLMIQINKNIQNPESLALYDQDEMDIIGVRHIFEQISTLKKPLIVHNGFIDILHIYDKFFYNLPDKSAEFKEKFKDLFPHLFDTKQMIQSSNLLNAKVGRQTDLSTSYLQFLKQHNTGTQIYLDQQLYYGNDGLTDKIFKIHEDFNEEQLKKQQQNQEKYQISQEDMMKIKIDQLKSHDAGVDALFTGYVFTKCIEELNFLKDFQQTFEKNNQMLPESIRFYLNKIPLGSIKVPFNISSPVDNYLSNNIKV